MTCATRESSAVVIGRFARVARSELVVSGVEIVETERCALIPSLRVHPTNPNERSLVVSVLLSPIYRSGSLMGRSGSCPDPGSGI
jgi:hypothetical protein